MPKGLPGGAPAQDQVVDLEERTWLGRHSRGDARAFPALLATYRRPIYGYLVRTGVPEAERDDLFQTIFLKVHRAARDYQPAKPLAPWLFTIAANSVRNHFRDRRDKETSADELPELADPEPGPERAAAARETVRWVEQALTRLPLAQREVLVLTTLVGRPQQEVAETLEMPLNTVKTHLRRARLALAKALAEREQSAGDPGDSHDDL